MSDNLTPRRGPDILQRTAPPLSASSADSPLAPTERPPLSASGDPADNAPEISPEAQGAATLAKQDGISPEQKSADAAAAAKAKADAEAKLPPAEGELEELDFQGEKIVLTKGVKREFAKVRNRQREAEAKAAAAIGELAGLKQELAELRAKLTPLEPPPAADPRPAKEAFATPEEHAEALAEWGIREGERKAAAKLAADKAEAEKAAADKAVADQKAAAEAELSRLNTSWIEKKAKVVATHPDYEAVAENSEINITTPMAHAILLSDNGPDIAYYLGKNLAEATRIAALAPAAQIVQIGRISEKLATPVVTRRREPAPIEPLSGGNSPATGDQAEPSMEAWAKKREAEIRASRKPFIQGDGRAPPRH